MSTPNSRFPTPKSALHAITRRFFFEQAYFGLGGLALASLLDPAVASAAQSERLRSRQAAGSLASLHHAAKAKRVDATLDVTLSNDTIAETFSDDVAIRR